MILNTNEDLIQSKIRELLIGTELEKIAKSAQIVIHIHEDAKDFLHQRLSEQQQKIEAANQRMNTDILEIANDTPTPKMHRDNTVVVSKLSPLSPGSDLYKSTRRIDSIEKVSQRRDLKDFLNSGKIGSFQRSHASDEHLRFSPKMQSGHDQSEISDKEGSKLVFKPKINDNSSKARKKVILMSNMSDDQQSLIMQNTRSDHENMSRTVEKKPSDQKLDLVETNVINTPEKNYGNVN